MKVKSIFTEFALLAGIFLFNLAALCVLFKTTNPFHVAFDINLHDTYFVLGDGIIVLLTYPLLSLLIYFVREGFNRFKRQFQNWITLVLNLLVLLPLAMLSLFLHMIPTSGWTVYPPLPALPQGSLNADYLSYFHIAKMMLSILVVLFIITLVSISIMIGRNHTTSNHGAKQS